MKGLLLFVQRMWRAFSICAAAADSLYGTRVPIHFDSFQPPVLIEQVQLTHSFLKPFSTDTPGGSHPQLSVIISWPDLEVLYTYFAHTPLFYVCELMLIKKYTDFSGRSVSRPVWWIIFTMLCLLYQPQGWLHTHAYLKCLETISAQGPVTLLIWCYQS